MIDLNIVCSLDVPGNAERKGAELKKERMRLLIEKSAKARIYSILMLCFFYLFCLMPDPILAATPKLSKTDIKMYVGMESRLSVSTLGKSAPKWSSSNKQIVSIKKVSAKSARLIAGGEPGTAIVSVKVSGKTLTCNVTVERWSFSLSNGSTIAIGKTTAFRFSGVKGKSFRSDNKWIATVNKNGMVTGKRQGTCHITYKVGRYWYGTTIHVVKSDPGPRLTLGTHVYRSGGSSTNVSTSMKAGETGDLEIINSAIGVRHAFYIYADSKKITSGLSITSSNTQVLNFDSMSENWLSFDSLQDGTTILSFQYDDPSSNKRYTYHCRVTIRDDKRTYYDGKRNEIYQSLGINASMPKQQICFLLASWICDHTVYDPEVKASLASSKAGVNSTYKDYFNNQKLVCAGYTDLYMYLCAGCSIPCRHVIWASRTHSWNQVQIDGQWYNVDVTWMDTATDGQFSFQFFLTSDNCMYQLSNQSHDVSPGNICSSPRFDGCCQEQLTLQNQWLKKEYTVLYASSSHLSPWITGTWRNY